MKARTRRLPLLVLMVAVSAGAVSSQSVFPISGLRLPNARKPAPTPAAASRSALAKSSRATGTSSLGTGSISGTLHRSGPNNTTIDVDLLDQYGYLAGNEYLLNDDTVFTFEGLYPGRYTITAEGTFYPNATTIANAQWIAVAEGQSVTGKDITVQPASGTACTISGTCYLHNDSLNRDGRIRFEALDTAANNGISWLFTGYDTDDAETDSAGRYAARLDLEPGWYYVMVTARDDRYRSYEPQWYDGTSVTGQPVPVYLAATNPAKDFHFSRGGTIAGHVSRGGSDATLYLVAIDSDGTVYGTGYVSAWDSSYAIKGLAAGTYFVKTRNYSSGNTMDFEDTWFPGTTNKAAAQAIVVTANDSVGGIDFSVAPVGTGPADATVRGTVTRAGTGGVFKNADVTATYVDETAGLTSAYSTSGDSDGTYSLTVDAGRDFVISAGWHQYGDPEYYLTETYYNGVTMPSAAQRLNLAAGDTREINIAVLQGGSIAGFVKDANGDALEAPEYMAEGLDGWWYWIGYIIATDDSYASSTFLSIVSGYRFAGVPDGQYMVRFLPYGGLFPDGGYAGLAGGMVPGATATAGQTTEASAMTMVAGNASITGTVNNTAEFAAEAVYVYDQNGYLAGISVLQIPLFNTAGGPKQIFFEVDGSYESAVYSPAPSADFSVENLAPGTYAVATLRYSNDYDIAGLQWYPNVLKPYDITDMVSIFHADIPAGATMITVGANQTKDNVDFGTDVGAIPSRPVPLPTSFSVRSSGARGMQINYALPSRMPDAMVRVFSAHGKLMARLVLNDVSGTLRWGEGASAGMYVVTLSAGDVTKSLRHMLVR